MTWSPNQQVALAVTPKISAFLSFAGSSWIVVQVVFDSQKRIDKAPNVFSRLLFGMSLFEALESIWNFASTWPIPRGTEGVFGARGSTQTCTAQGFFLQLGLAVPLYNACLATYYFLVIKYNVSDDDLRKYFEPTMHAIAVLFPLSTCIVCLALGLFNNANLWCWIAPLPLNCTGSGVVGYSEPCQRGDHAWIYRWAFYFAPLWSCIITVVVTMSLVYRFVRAKDERTLKYRRPRVRFGEDTMVRYSTPENEHHQPHSPSSCDIAMHEGASAGALAREDSIQVKDPLASGRSDRDSVELSLRHSLDVRSEASFTSDSAVSEETRHSNRSAISTRVREWQENRSQRIRDLRRSHDVWHQAFWYTFAFLWTHLFSTVNRTLQLTIGHTFFPLLLLHSFFDPFQGFLNFLVYRRPRYILLRRRGMPRGLSMKGALRWSSTFPANVADGGGSSSRIARNDSGLRRNIATHRPTVLRLTDPSSELGCGTGPYPSIDSELAPDHDSDSSSDQQCEAESENLEVRKPLDAQLASTALTSVTRTLDTASRENDVESTIGRSHQPANSTEGLPNGPSARRQSFHLTSFSALLIPESEANSDNVARPG